jgi:hypothetical protein
MRASGGPAAGVRGRRADRALGQLHRAEAQEGNGVEADVQAVRVVGERDEAVDAVRERRHLRAPEDSLSHLLFSFPYLPFSPVQHPPSTQPSPLPPHSPRPCRAPRHGTLSSARGFQALEQRVQTGQVAQLGSAQPAGSECAISGSCLQHGTARRRHAPLHKPGPGPRRRTINGHRLGDA